MRAGVAPAAASALMGKNRPGALKKIRPTICGITKPAIRRLARRGGVKRMSTKVVDATRETLKKLLTDVRLRWLDVGPCLTRRPQVIAGAGLMCEHSRRKTVSARDVVFSLQRMGVTVYGF